MQAQEIFDTVARTLLAQEARSSTDGLCMYRGSNGAKCAVGHLIPDEVYRPEMDMDPSGQSGTGVRELLKKYGDVLPSYFAEHVDLLMDLQEAHDGHVWSPSRKYMRQRLAEVAHRHDLNPDVALTAKAYGEAEDANDA